MTTSSIESEARLEAAERQRLLARAPRARALLNDIALALGDDEYADQQRQLEDGLLQVAGHIERGFEISPEDDKNMRWRLHLWGCS